MKYPLVRLKALSNISMPPVFAKDEKARPPTSVVVQRNMFRQGHCVNRSLASHSLRSDLIFGYDYLIDCIDLISVQLLSEKCLSFMKEIKENVIFENLSCKFTYLKSQ